MRTLPAGYDYTTYPDRTEKLLVEIKDGGGTFRDVSSWPGFDTVHSASWQEAADDPHCTAEVVLFREADTNLITGAGWSVAPLHATAPANLGMNPAGSYSPLIALGREIKISVSVSHGTGTTTSWLLVFHGRVDSYDAGSGDKITIQARDLGGKVMDTFIEEERVYAFGSVSGTAVSMRIWTPSTAYVVGDYVIPTEAKRNGKFYKCTTAGTSGSTEPTWPASSTVSDNSVVWTYQSTTSTSGFAVEQIMQNILDDNLGAGVVTLYVPTSPSWSIKQYIQSRTGTLDALRTLAAQIGWDCRYKWRSGTSAFELTLYQPDRTKATVDRTFNADEYKEVKRLSLSIADIRNAIRVVYSDSSDKDPTGQPKRKVIEVTDSTSITNYGRRFMEISESSSSQIDTSTEATSMANAAKSDLALPSVDHSIDFVHGFPWAELGDRYTLTANGLHYTTDQTLCVVGHRHECRDGFIRSSLDLRGKPLLGVSIWHEMSANVRGDVVPFRTFGAQSGFTLSAQAVIGGARLIVVPSDTQRDVASDMEFEFHVDTSSSFTPSSSTLKTVTRSRTVEITELDPATTYYARVVPRAVVDGRVVRSQHSETVTITPARASAAHSTADIDYGRRPLNGGFETRYGSGPPDHWIATLDPTALDPTPSASVWSNSFSAETSGGASGPGYLRVIDSATGGYIVSGRMLVRAGQSYLLSCMVKEFTADSDFRARVEIYWFDSGGSTTGTTVIGDSLGLSSWTLQSARDVSPASTVYARVIVTCYTSTAPHNGRAGVDDIRMVETNPGEDWIAPTLQNSWVDYASGTATSGYMMDTAGKVHIRGWIKSGTTTSGTLLFTLPTDYRPTYIHAFRCTTNGGSCEVRVNTDGTVKLGSTGDSTYTVLDGISFDVR